MAAVTVKELKINAVIGTLPHERVNRQQIIVDVSFEYDAVKAAETDDLSCSVDYSAVEKAIVDTVEKSSFYLLEALARQIALTVLSFAGVSKVEITIHKPAASAFGALISYTEEFFAGTEKK